jgi:D-Tyr-tRNAtyr deacylase
MTKNEFKLWALLAMCSNPAYASQSGINTEAMIEDAEALANKAKEIAYFEDASETIDRTFQDISSAIEEISMPDGKLDFMNDTLKGIERSLDYMNELIGKIIVEDEEAAEDCDV